MKLSLMLRWIVPALSLVAVSAGCQVQAVPNAVSLHEVIAAQDKALFDAYNTCDLAKLGTMVTDDLEFYHDKTGLAVGKQVFLDSIKQYICGKVRRELVPGTLEVHELAHYGALEIGVHRFHHPGQEDHDVLGEGKFVMLWQNKDGAWKLTRVISYDHATLPK